MASLQRVDEKGDLRMSFNLELVGFEIFQDGKVAKDWFEVRVWLVVFGLKIQFPGQQTMSVQDLEAFIKWLKGLSKSKGVNTFQTIHEPLFSMEAVTTGETFDIKTLISSYGAAPGFYSVDEGVSAQFTTGGDSVSRFANELETELSNVRHPKGTH